MIDHNTEPNEPVSQSLLDQNRSEINHSTDKSSQLSKQSICGDHVSDIREIRIDHSNDDQISEESHNNKTNREGSDDVFYSSNELQESGKPSCSVSESTSEEELNVKGITNENYDLQDFNKLTTDHTLDFETSTQLSTPEYYPRVNLFKEETLVSRNQFIETIKVSSNESNNIKTPGIGNDLSISSLIINNSSDETLDSEEDSNTSSGSLESSESYSAERNIFKKKHTSPVNCQIPYPMKSVNIKLSRVRNHIADLEEIDRQLSLIDKEIKSLPPTTKFDWTKHHVEPEMDNEMVQRFEGLQRNISSFLERTAIFESEENDLLDSDKSEASRCASSQPPQEVTETPLNCNLDMKENSNKVLPFQYLYNVRGNNPSSFELFPSMKDNPESEYCSPVYSETEDNNPRNSITSFKEKSNVPDTLGAVKDLDSHHLFETNHHLSEIELPHLETDNLDSQIPFSKGPKGVLYGPTNVLSKETDRLGNSKPGAEETVVKDDDIEGETIPLNKTENIESKELVASYKHLNHDTYRELIQRVNKNSCDNNDNETSRMYTVYRGNVKEAIKLFERKIADTKSVSGKSSEKLM